ncbi:hypothetical protein [Pseudofulvibacter geojedonensis]|uniref:Outer membrane protein beta-barrel domain-containing protein n=1 Tax=Pseudofulvibacter geojedonensis TaxID=1123758 RepID=A0ABW3I0N1_9FLAO
MNKFLFLLVFTLFSLSASAQISHTIDGKTYELTEEVTGKTSLFYAIIDGEYRYFIKKNDSVTELTNTKDSDGKYQEEYKEILGIITADAAMDISSVKLTLPSLKTFIDEYNKKTDLDYKMQANRPKAQARLGGFAGISNNPFVTNPDNIITPIFGAELELYDAKATRHSLALGFKQSLSNNDFKYSSSQFSLAYRFRVINKETFSIYPQATLATYTFSRTEITTVSEDGSTTTTSTESGSTLDAPIILGVGTDIKLGNGYLTLSMNELVALINIENQGNFPLDLRLGYKFNL